MICRSSLANACLEYEMAQSVPMEGKEHTKKTMQKSKPAAISTANRNSQPDVIESRAVPRVVPISEFKVGLQRIEDRLMIIEWIVTRIDQGQKLFNSV
jgi:hypothetical protein